MEIKINTICNEDVDRVVNYVKNFCIENFREFELFIDGELQHEQKEEKKQ